MTRKLAWEKWHNEVQKEKITLDNGSMDNSEIIDDFDQMGDKSEFMSEMFFIPRKLSTPFGLYEPDDPLCPTNMFDCWIAHSNFPICEREYNILNDDISGLGAFKVISKYRFFIGVEKMFNFRDVRREIEYKICHIDDDILNFGVY